MANLILIKHSLPEIIPTIPAGQWGLSDIGRLRAKALAKKIEPYAPDLVISSTEPKAIETAQIVASRIGKPFRTFENLHEHDRTGVLFSDKEQFEADVKAFFDFPEKLVMGNETASQARARFSRAITSLETEYPEKSLAVVAHGTVITLFVAQAVGLEPFSLWKKLDLPSFVVFSLPQLEFVTIEERAYEQR